MDVIIFLRFRWNSLVIALNRLINEAVTAKHNVANFNQLRALRAIKIDFMLEQMGYVLERITANEVHTLGDPIFSAIDDLALAREMLPKHKDSARMFIPISDMRADLRCIQGFFHKQDVDSEVWSK